MLHFFRRESCPPIEDGDAALASLGDELESMFAALYSAPARPPAHNWAAVATASNGVLSARSRSGPMRLAGSLAAGALALLLCTAGYAAITGASLADHMFGNFGDTPTGEGAHAIGLSQSSSGITVTVDHVVFDAEAAADASVGAGETVVPLMVQITVSGEPRPYSITASLRGGGVDLRQVGGVGLRGQSEVLGRSLPPGTEQALFAFDATGLAPAPSELALQLEVMVAPRGNSGDRAPGEQVIPSDSPAVPPLRFVFDFTVPRR